jgi:hypothetical protein
MTKNLQNIIKLELVQTHFFFFETLWFIWKLVNIRQRICQEPFKFICWLSPKPENVWMQLKYSSKLKYSFKIGNDWNFVNFLQGILSFPFFASNLGSKNMIKDKTVSNTLKQFLMAQKAESEKIQIGPKDDGSQISVCHAPLPWR